MGDYNDEAAPRTPEGGERRPVLGFLDEGYRVRSAVAAEQRERLEKYGLNSPTSPTSPPEAAEAAGAASARKVVLKVGAWGKAYASGEHQIPQDPPDQQCQAQPAPSSGVPRSPQQQQPQQRWVHCQDELPVAPGLQPTVQQQARWGEFPFNVFVKPLSSTGEAPC